MALTTICIVDFIDAPALCSTVFVTDAYFSLQDAERFTEQIVYMGEVGACDNVAYCTLGKRKHILLVTQNMTCTTCMQMNI